MLVLYKDTAWEVGLSEVKLTDFTKWKFCFVYCLEAFAI